MKFLMIFVALVLVPLFALNPLSFICVLMFVYRPDKRFSACLFAAGWIAFGFFFVSVLGIGLMKATLIDGPYPRWTAVLQHMLYTPIMQAIVYWCFRWLYDRHRAGHPAKLYRPPSIFDKAKR